MARQLVEASHGLIRRAGRGARGRGDRDRDVARLRIMERAEIARDESELEHEDAEDEHKRPHRDGIAKLGREAALLDRRDRTARIRLGRGRVVRLGC